VERKTSTSIGIVTYHHRETANRRLEIGYILGRAYWRRGLMREAIQALINYCFGALAMHRIEVTVCPENDAAVRFTESLGFHREGGPLRDRSLVHGQYRDLLLYGLLDRDWQAKTVKAEAAMIYAINSRQPELRPI
jgi:ribosomal-protein-alanine N-acetyltransferase